MNNEKLYTIREIAEIIGVSKQAIHKKIKQEPLSTSLQSLTSTTDNAIHVTVDGLSLIKSAFDRDSPSTVAVNVDSKTVNQVDDATTKLIDSLQEQIAYFKKQIAQKDSIIIDKDKNIKELTDKITELSEKLATLFENSQQLQQNQQLLQAKFNSDSVQGEDIKKVPLLIRIFKKK